MSGAPPGRPFSAAERRRLAAALARGEPLVCPRCGIPLAGEEVRPGPGVPYVRSRVLVVCPACRGSAALDRPPQH